jgi:cell wall-associated NlpC family hydrolase
MSPDRAKKIILVSVIGMVLITIAGDAVEGKAPKPARFLALGFIILLLVGGAELAPGIAAAFAMVAVVAVALERLGPIATRVAGVVGGRVPLGSLSSTDTAGSFANQTGGVDTVNPTGRPSPTSAISTPKGEAIVRTARHFIGVPYLWGGDSISGFDCSGLTQWCYGHNGITIPRVAAAQFAASRRVAAPAVGDLVFFGHPVHHVGIVTGNGKMIDAPHTGAFVREETYTNRSDIAGYGRFT